MLVTYTMGIDCVPWIPVREIGQFQYFLQIRVLNAGSTMTYSITFSAKILSSNGKLDVMNVCSRTNDFSQKGGTYCSGRFGTTCHFSLSFDYSVKFTSK